MCNNLNIDLVNMNVYTYSHKIAWRYPEWQLSYGVYNNVYRETDSSCIIP